MPLSLFCAGNLLVGIGPTLKHRLYTQWENHWRKLISPLKEFTNWWWCLGERWSFCNLVPLINGTQSVLDLARPHVCQLWCVRRLWYPRILQLFHIFCWRVLWTLRGRYLMEKSQLRLNILRSLILYTLSVCGSLCYFLSAAEGALMMIEQDTDLWLEQNDIRSHFVAV